MTHPGGLTCPSCTQGENPPLRNQGKPALHFYRIWNNINFLGELGDLAVKFWILSRNSS